MELPNIGKQCSVPDCKQLDFLPFECSCKLVFCHEHFKQHVENCPERKFQENPQKVYNDVTVYICSKTGCKERSIVPLICQKCNKHYCISHRHINSCEEIDEKELQAAIERVQAPKKQFEEAKAIIDKEIESTLKNAKRKDKNQEMANKVQLMRLKAKATGIKTIPAAGRVYFTTHNSKYCPEGKPVYVASDWTIGRAIDAIATECKIPNNNNLTAAAKLRLFRKSDGQILSENMSDKLNVLIEEKVIFNGESLIMDYL